MLDYSAFGAAVATQYLRADDRLLFIPGPNGETWRPSNVSSPVWMDVMKSVTMTNFGSPSLKYAGAAVYEEGKVALLPKSLTEWGAGVSSEAVHVDQDFLWFQYHTYTVGPPSDVCWLI